jgi:pseudouridine-5'-phosphate glycosidase
MPVRRLISGTAWCVRRGDASLWSDRQGQVVAVPIPESQAAAAAPVERAIQQAIHEAECVLIKAVTSVGSELTRLAGVVESSV